MIKNIRLNSITTPVLLNGAIIRNDFPGFKEDYIAIHCLIRKYKPKTFLEIGTSTGSGTRVICKAMNINRSSFLERLFGLNKKSKSNVYSIDVPPGTDPSKIYPGKEDGHPDKAGKYCEYPYLQLFGDSTKFDFRKYYPIDGWFIDGKHDYKYARKDTLQALKSKPKIIIWHDMQIAEVERAVKDISLIYKDYSYYRVAGTRIGFAIKKL